MVNSVVITDFSTQEKLAALGPRAYARAQKNLAQHNNRLFPNEKSIPKIPEEHPADSIANPYFDAALNLKSGSDKQFADSVDLLTIPGNRLLIEYCLKSFTPIKVIKTLIHRDPNHASIEHPDLNTTEELEAKIVSLKQLLKLKEKNIPPKVVEKLVTNIHLPEVRKIIDDAIKLLGQNTCSQEASAFISYSSASEDVRKLADKLSAEFNDPNMKTYAFKSKITNLLEDQKGGLRKEEVDFIDNIINLKAKRYADGSVIDGVDRLLSNALKAFSTDGDIASGFYKEASAAVRLINNNFKVKHLSVAFELNPDGSPKLNRGEKVSLRDDDFIDREIDIIAESPEGKIHYFEVKAAPSVLYSANFQNKFVKEFPVRSIPCLYPQEVALAKIANKNSAVFAAYITSVENDNQSAMVRTVRQLVSDRTGLDMRVFVGGMDSSAAYYVEDKKLFDVSGVKTTSHSKTFQHSHN